MNVKQWMKVIWQSHYVRGGVVFTTISFVVSLLNYVFNFLAARLFPLSSYGEYVTALAYMAVLTVPLGVVNILLVKKLGAVRISQRSALTAGLEKKLLKLVTGKLWLWLIIAVGLVSWLKFESHLNLWSSFWVVAMSVMALISVFYVAALQAHKLFWQSGVINVLSTLVKIILIVLFIQFSLSVLNLYLAIFISATVAVFLSRRVVIKSQSDQKFAFPQSSFVIKKFFTRERWLALLSTLGVVGMLSVDVMMVKNFFSADDVGLYGGLSLLGKIVLFVTAPLATVAFSFFTSRESRKSSHLILVYNILLIIFAGICLVVAYLTLPDAVILAVLGPKFLVIDHLIYKSAIFGLLYSLNNSLSQYALSQNHVIALVPLFITMIQLVSLWIYHQSFEQIININIMDSGVAVLIFLVWFVRSIFDSRVRAKLSLHKK